MATQAGKAYVTVDYDPGSIRRLGQTTKSAARGVEGTWLGSAKRIATGIGLYYGGLAAVKAVFLDPIRSAGQFQETLNVLQATVGATGRQMRAASSEAIALGKDVKLPATTASDAAVAMTELGKAGFNAQQAMDAARGTLLLTTAAQTDEATAAKIAANAINVFNLRAGQAGQVADLLAGAANASSADITDLADALQYAGTGASHAGQSIQDTVAAVAEMANAGQSGSTAGSALAQMFRALQAPSGKAADAMKKFGLNVYDSNQRMKPLPELVSLFSSKLGGMTQKQQAATLATIFGSRAIRAAQIVLLGGAKNYDKLRDAVTRAGAAQRLATAHTKGFRGSLQALQSSFETLQLEIGLKVLPVLTPLVDMLARIVGAPSLSIAVKVAFQGIEAGAHSLAASVRGALFGETKTTVIKAPSLGGMRKVGITQTQTQGIVGSLQSALAGAQWGKIGATIGTAIGSSIVFGADAIDSLVVGLTSAVNAHRGDIAEAGVLLTVAFFDKILDPGFWITHWKAALTVAGAALLVVPGGPLAKAAEKVLPRFILGPLRAIGKPLKAVLGFVGRQIGRGLADVFPEASRGARAIVTRILGPLRRLPGAVRDLVGGMARAAGQMLGFFARDAGNAARRIVDRIIAPFRSLAGRVIGPVIRAGRAVINAIGGFVGQAFAKGAELGRGLIDGIVSGLSGLFSRVYSAVTSGISSAISSAKSFFHIRSPSRYTAEQIGRPLAEGIAVGIDDHSHRVRASLERVMVGARSSSSGGGRGLTVQLNVDLGDGIRQIVTTQVDLASLFLQGEIRAAAHAN